SGMAAAGDPQSGGGKGKKGPPRGFARPTLSKGIGCGRPDGWWAPPTKPTSEICPAFYCRRLTARQLADTAIAQPLWPVIAQPIAPTPERPLQHPSISAVSSATARPAHAARATLRNASAVPLQALPPGPIPAPFSALKPDHALPEPNSSRGAALSVPRTC